MYRYYHKEFFLVFEDVKIPDDGQTGLHRKTCHEIFNQLFFSVNLLCLWIFLNLFSCLEELKIISSIAINRQTVYLTTNYDGFLSNYKGQFKVTTKIPFINSPN